MSERTFKTTLPLMPDAQGLYLKPEFWVLSMEPIGSEVAGDFDVSYNVGMRAALYVPKDQELRIRIENDTLVVECVKLEKKE